MKWYGITGSWRKTSAEVEADVRKTVREIIGDGDGIVTGGALNVDWFATDEALKMDSTTKHIRVCLPVTLERYVAHYRQRADEGVITHNQAEMLIEQLTRLKQANHEALIEHPTNTVVDQTTYFARNTQVVELSDVMVGFQVNGSAGVQDTIDKAAAQGKEVQLKQYTIN
jgi:predicted Rossmann fold nucleotide-binding protein DprA/Smf involved in DNA uptake